MPQADTRITFTNAQGEELAARLAEPPGEVRAYALFAHCFTCSKDLRAVRTIGDALSELGIGTLRFDFTGLGESEGDFAETTFSSNVDDLLAAAAWMTQAGRAPSLLIGHSLGGAAVLAAADRLPEVQAVATIGAPAHPDHVRRLFGAQTVDIERAGEAVVELAGRPFRVKRSFLDDLGEHGSQDAIRRLGRPLLILHSPTDDTVGVDNARDIYEAARHPKSFVSLDGADHLLTQPRDARYAAQVMAAWAERYLPAGPEALPEGDVRVRGRRALRQEVRATRHVLSADEPRRLGGTDTGPTPYDYLLGALGTCTSMTLRMYADRKRWPLEAVNVKLSHTRIHAEDCADCEKETGLIDVMQRRIELQGDLDDAQRARLLEIADKCPVHRTLTNELRIETKAAE